MAAGKELSGAGLRGQVAGKTALSTVGKSGSGLTYRGYDVKDLAANCEFEEVAYLILKGELPTQAELDAYKTKLKGMRGLPQALKEVLHPENHISQPQTTNHPRFASGRRTHRRRETKTAG